MENHIENTSTFLVLIFNQWRRVQSMYDPKVRRLENQFSTCSLIGFCKQIFRNECLMDNENMPDALRRTRRL